MSDKLYRLGGKIAGKGMDLHFSDEYSCCVYTFGTNHRGSLRFPDESLKSKNALRAARDGAVQGRAVKGSASFLRVLKRTKLEVFHLTDF